MFTGINLNALACHFAAQYRAARCTGEATFAVGTLTARVNYDDYVYVVQLTEIDAEVRVNAWAVECYERDYGVLSDVESAAALTYITDACRALAATKAAGGRVLHGVSSVVPAVYRQGLSRKVRTMIVVTMGELATYYTTVKRFADKPRRPLYVSVGHTNDNGQTWVKLGYWQYRVDASDKRAMERMQYLGRDNGAWADYERGLLLAERLLCEAVTPGLSSGVDWSQPCHIDGLIDGQLVRFIVTDYN